MSSVLITFEMAEMIAARVASLPRGAREVNGLKALPLYDDIEGVIGIRPDGTLVEWSHDGGRRGARPVADRVWVLIALAAGVRRYPELQSLLPVRVKGTVGCACRSIPVCVSGLIYCDCCGGMGWLPAGRSRAPDWPDRTGRASSRFAFVFVILAFASFFGAFVVLTVPSRAFIWNGLTLMGVGILSLVLASNGVVRRRPGRRRIARGPTFTADDPEVAALPPTSMTRVSERIRLDREQRERAEE